MIDKILENLIKLLTIVALVLDILHKIDKDD